MFIDAALIQIAATSNNCGDVPKRALLATVRSSHSRGRCRRLQIKQTLTDCPQHCHGTPVRAVCAPSSDLEEADDTEENDSRFSISHNFIFMDLYPTIRIIIFNNNFKKSINYIDNINVLY